VRFWRGRDDGADRGALVWLVVGLGNPGPRYAGSRHNIGREVVEALASRHHLRLDRTKFNARYGCGPVAGRRVGLAAPLTYMNVSGQAVAPLARFFKVPPEQLLLVYDDLDLPLGSLRLRRGGGSGGHNGVASVAGSLGTAEIPRLRVGIGRPPPGWDAADYVLAGFTPDELATVAATLPPAVDAIEAVLRDGLDAAMNAVNR